jgi:hypothetical protein
MRIIDPPSRISGRALWTVKIAPFTLTPKTRSNPCSVARKPRDRGAPRITPVAAACRVWDASSAIVRAHRRTSAYSTADRWRGKILPAPRRASLRSSAAICSAQTFAALSSRRLRGFPVLSSGLNSRDRERCRSQVLSRKRSTAEASVRFCARVKLFNGLTSFFCNSKSRQRFGAAPFRASQRRVYASSPSQASARQNFRP